MKTIQLKISPIWILWGSLLVSFLLIETLLSACSSNLATENRLAYLSVINGDVIVSDGITEVAAEKGALTPRDARTMLMTRKGNVLLITPEGSYVILDSDSAIEFNRQNENNSGKSFAFNLINGRAMVINGQDSKSPIQVFLGGHITAQVFQAAMGLEVQTDGNILESVDCLAGSCLVGGNSELTSEQNARISQDSTVKISNGVNYDGWKLLGRASNPDFALSNLLASIFPTITLTISPGTAPKEATPTLPFTSTNTSTSSPSPTRTTQLTATPTATNTKKPVPITLSQTPTSTNRARRHLPASTGTLAPPTLPPPPTTAPLYIIIQP